MDNEEEEEEPEERLTAHSYGALDTSQVTEECWLIRIPQKLAQAWESLPEGTDLGELVFTKGGEAPAATPAKDAASAAAVSRSSAGKRTVVKPSIAVHVAEHVAESFRKSSAAGKAAAPSSRLGPIKASNALPLNYSLQAMTKKIPVLHPFSRNPRTGSVKFWGTVSRTANLQVEREDEQYRALLKDRLVATNITNNRYVKPVEATESVMSKQRPTAVTTAVSSTKKKTFGDAVLQFGKRRLEAIENSGSQGAGGAGGGAGGAVGPGGSKKARQFAPDQPMRSVIFELFAQSAFWAVKDLKAAAVNGGAINAGSRKGESEIRDILREIGEYHRSGDHKNMWELRKEFQQQN